MLRILSLLFLTTAAFDSNSLEKDDECGGSDGSTCVLHALQRSARPKETATDMLSRRQRSKLHAYARQLQPGIVHVWKQLKIMEIRSNYAADQVEVDLGIATDGGKDDAPETANDDDEIKKKDMDLMEMESEEEDEEDHPHHSEHARSQARIRSTVKEQAYLQKELDLEWKMLHQTSEKEKATTNLLKAHGFEDLNTKHFVNEAPLEYEQCAGKGYKGPAECADGAICVKKSEWFSICQPAQENFLDSQGLKDPDAEAALLQHPHHDQTLAGKFMNDMMQMHLQLEKLRQQLEDLNENLAFIEQKAGRTTHELMPCSGTEAAPKQCYSGKILLEHIHVISDGSHVNVSAVKGSHAFECNNLVLSFDQNLGTVKCQQGDFLNLTAAMQYCPDQQQMLLSVVLPKRKEKIKTVLKPTTCSVDP